MDYRLNQKNSQTDLGLLANAVAISASFHTDKRFDEFYGSACGRGLNGFTAIYDLCIEMAQCMSMFEENKEDIWEEFDWTEIVEKFTNSMIEFGINSKVASFKPDITKMLNRTFGIEKPKITK